MVLPMLEKEEYKRLLAIAAPRTSAALFAKYSTLLPVQRAPISGDNANGQLLRALELKYAQAENELKDKLLAAANGPQLPSE
jgi:hypothetical protein